MTYSGATTFNAPTGRYAASSDRARTASYSASGVIAINTVIATYDCTTYQSLSIQCSSMGTTGVVTPEWSNDNTNWAAATIFTAAGATATTITAAGLWVTPVISRYLRLRVSTATTAGTTSFTSLLLDDDFSTGDVGVQYRTTSTGSASTVSVLSPATPAAATIKGSAGRLLGFCLQNSSAGVRSVKLFNATAPTLGTTSAAFEVDIPAGGVVSQTFEGGVSFATACTYSVTSAKGLTDNTATGLAANDVSGFFAFA